MMTLLLALTLAQTATPKDLGAPALAAQDARFAALLKADTAYLEGALDPSLTYQHSTGLLQNKTEFIASIRDGAFQYKGLEILERRVRVFGTVAIVTGLVRMQVVSGGQSADVKARFTDVYESRGGRYIQVAWQNTRVP